MNTQLEINIPKHIGIILDGNRRFAKKLLMQPWKGHEMGAAKIEKLFDWLKELGVKELTLYCFSIENFNRPKEEFDFLMNIFKKEFKRLIAHKDIHNHKIRINFAGRTELFDEELQNIIKELEDKTKDYENYAVNFALGYGGRQEIVEAIKKLIESGEDITEENFKKNLWVKNDPDLIIRTGGDKRTSNFLPWQSTYSEWFFLEKTWPEFEKIDLIKIINKFGSRERRFGR